MRRIVFVMCCISCCLFIPSGCGSQKDMAKAEAAVVLFHEQLNEGNFDKIYSDSDYALKSATSQEKMVNLLAAVHRKLGAVKSANRESFLVNYSTSGETVRLSYTTQFESDKAAEEFVFLVRGDEVRLAGYNINSDTLITK